MIGIVAVPELIKVIVPHRAEEAVGSAREVALQPSAELIMQQHCPSIFTTMAPTRSSSTTSSKKDKVTGRKATVKESPKVQAGIQLVAPMKRWQRSKKAKIPLARYIEAREAPSLDGLASYIMAAEPEPMAGHAEHRLQHGLYLHGNGQVHAKREETPMPDMDDDAWDWMPDEEDLGVEPTPATKEDLNSTPSPADKHQDRNSVHFPSAIGSERTNCE
ncbi:hypothetical protein NEOLEDRAFT_1143673 [Neolentinus lepideus HHB14362 ss-1]|uniref:Uncharacterized protein n=1 Tax=Neolentinus lepideus HHB14362 ss-1 TaxID=1314782 RepID=A0A165MEE7_9AGAM|nr:hypothetical protein NEOLEDRAFT_1143673 [Neolentinus lepideus HHB14362 ss-1]